jgi:hypothetical protein
MRWLILGNVCDQPPLFERIGNRGVGSLIVQAGGYHSLHPDHRSAANIAMAGNFGAWLEMPATIAMAAPTVSARTHQRRSLLPGGERMTIWTLAGQSHDGLARFHQTPAGIGRTDGMAGLNNHPAARRVAAVLRLLPRQHFYEEHAFCFRTLFGK